MEGISLATIEAVSRIVALLPNLLLGWVYFLYVCSLYLVAKYDSKVVGMVWHLKFQTVA